MEFEYISRELSVECCAVSPHTRYSKLSPIRSTAYKVCGHRIFQGLLTYKVSGLHVFCGVGSLLYHHTQGSATRSITQMTCHRSSQIINVHFCFDKAGEDMELSYWTRGRLLLARMMIEVPHALFGVMQRTLLPHDKSEKIGATVCRATR